jgi:hypothetical protein
MIDLPDDRHIVVLSIGFASSGIPPAWAAGLNTPGVDWLPDAHRSCYWLSADPIHGTTANPPDAAGVRVPGRIGMVAAPSCTCLSGVGSDFELTGERHLMLHLSTSIGVA